MLNLKSVFNIILIMLFVITTILANACNKKSRSNSADLNLSNAEQIEEITKSIIKGYEYSSDVEYCKDFILTKEQVIEYFKNAKIISVHDLNGEYNWAPCIMKGTLKIRNKRIKWEIQATFVGKIIYPDGNEVLYGIDDVSAEKIYKMTQNHQKLK